jgi:hypothetical protein
MGNSSHDDQKIKTALEIALEKASKISIPEEELERDKCIEEGKLIAARYLQRKIKKTNLKEEVEKFEKSFQVYVKEGIQSIFLLNITLPDNEGAKKEIRYILEGMVMLKQNVQPALQVCSEIEELLTEYLRVKSESYRALKHRFSLQLRETQKMLEEQTGLKIKIDVERQPEFQKLWSETIAQINEEFEQQLRELKAQLKDIK